jgi:hypothetical protein
MLPGLAFVSKISERIMASTPQNFSKIHVNNFNKTSPFVQLAHTGKMALRKDSLGA